MLAILALAAPHAFVEAIEHRLAGTQMHVTDWWADDLDGDHVPEAIATVCDDSSAMFLVLRGKDLLEAPIVIDGRNQCGEEKRPDWIVSHTHELSTSQSVHHGATITVFSIRDGQLVKIREESHGFDVNRDGSHDDDDMVTDFDKLTYTDKQTGHRMKRAALILATPTAKRVTPIVGKTTASATWKDNDLTLHLHADKPVVVKVCSATPCAITKVAVGDHDVVVEDVEFDLVVGGKTVPIHVEHIDADQRFPPTGD